jgi:hypothetical protein
MLSPWCFELAIICIVFVVHFYTFQAYSHYASIKYNVYILNILATAIFFEVHAACIQSQLHRFYVVE